MRKYILPVLFVVALLFFAFAIYSYSSKNSKLFGLGNNNSLSPNKESGNNESGELGTLKKTSKSTEEDLQSENQEGLESSSSPSEEDNSQIPPEERENKPSCILIRPGNLPNINCSVNYIKKSDVSMKIENKLGEDIGITLDLKSCSPKITDSIKNNEKKDFNFSCNNQDYFSQDIIVTYNLKQNGTVTVGGFVTGPVIE